MFLKNFQEIVFALLPNIAVYKVNSLDAKLKLCHQNLYAQRDCPRERMITEAISDTAY